MPSIHRYSHREGSRHIREVAFFDRRARHSTPCIMQMKNSKFARGSKGAACFSRSSRNAESGGRAAKCTCIPSFPRTEEDRALVIGIGVRAIVWRRGRSAGLSLTKAFHGSPNDRKIIFLGRLAPVVQSSLARPSSVHATSLHRARCSLASKVPHEKWRSP